MSKKLAVRIGLRISELRKLKGLTMEKLAYEMGISKGYLSDVENGNKIPSVEMLERIAKELNVDIVDIFKKP